MKLRFPWIPLAAQSAVIAAGTATTRAEAPDLPGAAVTLPYAEVQRLWAAAREASTGPEPVAPPVPAVFGRLAATLRLTETEAALKAVCEVESFAETWHEIPLLATSARLVAVDPPDAAIVWKEDRYVWLRRSAGAGSVTLSFVSARSGGRLETIFDLAPGPATVQTLEVTGLPPDRSLVINGVPVPAYASGPGLVLPRGEAPLRLELVPREDPAVAERKPSTWDLASQIVVSAGDGALHYDIRLLAQDRTGPGEELQIVLPARAREIRIASEGLRSSRGSRSADGGMLQRLVWEDSGVVDRQIDLGFSVPVSPAADQWSLFVPKAVEGEGERTALFVVPLADGLEIQGDRVTAASGTGRLPAWLQDRVGGREFVSLEADGDAVVRPRWKPRRPPAQATVTEARFETRLERNGQTLNRSTYIVAHDGSQAWRIALPDPCDILRCTVAGQPAIPVTVDDRFLELTLAAGDAGGTTEVCLDYVHRIAPLEEVEGSVVLSLPETPLFIHRLDWIITLPDGTSVTALDGNLEVSPSGPGGENVASLNKNLCQAEAPVVEIFYNRTADSE